MFILRLKHESLFLVGVFAARFHAGTTIKFFFFFFSYNHLKTQIWNILSIRNKPLKDKIDF